MRLRTLCLLSSLAACPAVASDAPKPDAFARVAWLAGCWQAEGGEPGSVEQWLHPAGGTMLGMSRTVRGGETVAHEFLQIRRRADGALVFIANPSGQAEATFALQDGQGDAAVFANPAHDFPQRVIYRRVGADRLAARIEGTQDGKDTGIDFPMRRAACTP